MASSARFRLGPVMARPSRYPCPPGSWSSRSKTTCLVTACPPDRSAPDGPRLHDGVHVGTLQRFKGLEYQRMILAGIIDTAIPGHHVAPDPARQQLELMRARSLLFGAATRARDALVISWNGQPSRFLLPVS